MPETQWREEIVRPVRVLQIITGALGGGGIVWVAMVLFMRLQDDGPAPGAAEGPMLVYLALGFAAAMLLARAVVPARLVSTSRRKIAEGTWKLPKQTGGDSSMFSPEFLAKTGDAGKLCSVFMMKTMVETSMLEGAAFFALVAYLIEGITLSLATATVLIVAVALHFPTRGRVVGWIERQLTLLDEQRQWES
ncbi:MAG: hypothetical protein HQ582_22085 [Planctomycetes bacterium]|nr:hypothetical protein [Planctomycetota bacterium]